MPQPSAHLQRLVELDDRTLGRLTLYPERRPPVELVTLELPWVDLDLDGRSDNGVSRLEAGAYKVVPHHSARFPRTFRLLETGHRVAILVHAGNGPAHTRGCVLVGLRFADFDGDERGEAASSREAVQAIRDAFGKAAWTLTISDVAPALDAELAELLAEVGIGPVPDQPLG